MMLRTRAASFAGATKCNATKLSFSLSAQKPVRGNGLLLAVFSIV